MSRTSYRTDQTGSYPRPLSRRERVASGASRVRGFKRELRIRNLVEAPALIALAVVVLGFSLPAAFGQIATGSLNRTVTDTSGAVIPGAKVALTNEATPVDLTTFANGKGFFSFPRLQPATDDLTVSSRGFKSWPLKGITMATGESRTVPKIALQLGTTTQTVVVSGTAVLAPLDTGATSTTLTFIP